MKKICFIGIKAYQLFNPEVKSTFGGAEVQLSLLAKEFSKNKDLEISFLVADYGQEDKETHNNVSVYKSFPLQDNIIKKIYKFFRVFQKINADIYIQRTLTPFSGLIALYCKVFGKKFIYMVAHDNETDNRDKLFSSIIGRFLIKLNFKLASKIITQNQYQKEKLKEKGVDSVIILSGYNINDTQIKNKKNILWVSRSEEWKQPEIFIKLAKKNPKYNFIMICPKTTSDKDYFNQIKKKALRVKNIAFHDFIAFNDIDIFFKQAKVFINTSISEGFPNTFIQAMKNKTPILSMNVDPNGILTKYGCGILCNNDDSKLNNLLQDILINKKQYIDMQEKCYDYVVENHNIEKNAILLLKVINQK